MRLYRNIFENFAAKRKMKKIPAGTILVAEPFMEDPHFKRSVVLVCDNEEGGTIGFILNKPQLRMNITELIAEFPDFESEVHYGGPVATDTIHYLHNQGHLLDGSQKVAPGVYWGGEFEKLKVLVATGLILPEHIRFFLGYSGWAAGQLDSELQHGSWIASEMDPNYLYRESADSLWRRALEDKGDTFGVIGQMPEGISPN